MVLSSMSEAVSGREWIQDAYPGGIVRNNIGCGITKEVLMCAAALTLNRHLRQMLVVGEQAHKHIDDFSKNFQDEFLTLLSRRYVLPKTCSDRPRAHV
jgi:hypothetical protein